MAARLALGGVVACSISLVGEAIGWNLPASLGGGHSPLHSVIGTLLLMLGFGSLIAAGFDRSTSPGRWARVLACLVAVVSAAMFLDHLLDYTPLAGDDRHPHTWQMALDLSICLLAVAQGVMDPRKGGLRGVVGFLAALGSVGLGLLILLLFAVGLPLIYNPLGSLTCVPVAVACMLLGLAQWVRMGTSTWPPLLVAEARTSDGDAEARRFARSVSLLFFGVAVTVMVGGAVALRAQVLSALREVEERVGDLAELRATQLSSWYHEREGDASVVLGAGMVQESLRQALEAHAPPAVRHGVQEWMEQVRSAYKYHAVALYDSRGRRVLSAGACSGSDPGEGEIGALLRAKGIEARDLCWEAASPGLYLDFWIPVGRSAEHGAVGLLRLRSEVREQLNCLLSSRTHPGSGAETLLVRLESSRWVVLARARGFLDKHGDDGAGGPADPALFHSLLSLGCDDVVRVQGHGGASLFATLRPVSGTSWSLVTSIDEESALGPLQFTVILAGFGILGLELAVALLLGLILRQQESLLARRRKESERVARQAEGVQREGERRFKSLFDHAPVPTWEHDHLEFKREVARLRREGVSDFRTWFLENPLELRRLARSLRIVDVNQESLRFFGAASKEEIARNLPFYFRDDCWPVFSSLGAALADGATSLEAEIPVHDCSGALRHVLFRLSTVPDAEHSVSRVLVSFLDITEAKRQAAVEQARLRLLEYADSHSLADLLRATLDEAGVLTNSPLGFYHVLEPDQKTLSMQAWSTRTVKEFCRATPGQEHLSVPEGGIWADCIRQKRPLIHNDYAMEADPARLPRGHAEVLRVMMVPVVRGDLVVGVIGVGNKPRPYDDEDLEVVRLLADVAWDIVDRKRADEARHALQAQLHQAQKMESLGSLAGGVAHDLNNVLGAVLSLATLHRAQVEAADPLAASLDTMASACLRGRDVIKRLLRFARKDLEEERPVDINAVIRDLVALLSHTTLNRATLQVDLQEPLPPLLGDAGTLSNALMNLCVNAVDAMPRGGTITLVTRRQPDGGVSVVVRDTGEGMSPEVQARAADPFFTTKPVGKGTGLGLATVYGTVRAHDGTLQIHSEVGVGTTVTMLFPSHRVVTQEPEAAACASPPPVVESRMRILLVDDDDLVRRSVRGVLEFLGHEAVVAGGGRPALRMIEEGLEVDLVILDMNMPDLGGAETLSRLLAMRPEQRVLVASGYLDASVQALMDRPTLSTISKPFTLDEIRRKVVHFGA